MSTLTPDADDLLRSGDLAGARTVLVEEVRASPSDPKPRMFLFQLQCVLGEWDSAERQLRALAQVSPEAQMLALAYGQLIEAERTRAGVFAGREPPALLVGSSPWAAELATSLGALAQGRQEEAEAHRRGAFDAATDTPGEIDGTRFEWIADADMRFGPALEAVIGGRWGLLPFDAVTAITGDGVTDLRDLVWLPVQIMFRSGQSAAGFLPNRYPGSEAAADPTLQLARRTEWRDEPWGQAGLGQRLLSLSDGSEVSLASLRRLSFD